MGTERGAANLARFNAERSAQVVPKLVVELHLCAKRKLKFDSMGLLAAYLSDRVAVHRTTLMRNTIYKEMLEAYWAGQAGVVSLTPDSTSDPAILRVKLAAAKLEASNFREELAFCKSQLKRHASNPQTVSKESTADFSYADLAMVMVNLLHRFPDFVSLDRQQIELIDLSAKPSARVIAGKERLGSFVRWLEINQALPMIQALVLGNAGSR